MISRFPSRRRSLAAQLAPPATPPIITVLLIDNTPIIQLFYQLFKCLYRMQSYCLINDFSILDNRKHGYAHYTEFDGKFLFLINIDLAYFDFKVTVCKLRKYRSCIRQGLHHGARKSISTGLSD